MQRRVRRIHNLLARGLVQRRGHRRFRDREAERYMNAPQARIGLDRGGPGRGLERETKVKDGVFGGYPDGRW